MMKYRKTFHLSYEQFLDTPIDIIYTDLEMIDIEAELQNKYQSKLVPKK